MNTPAWQNLASQYDRFKDVHMRDLFNSDANRAAKSTESACGFTLDYSKNRIDDAVLSALFDLAREAGVESKRDAMCGREASKFYVQNGIVSVCRPPAGKRIITEKGYLELISILMEDKRCLRPILSRKRVI